MAEKVLVASVRQPDRAVLMDARIARALVARGSFQFVEVVEPEKVAKPKKRAYKRRDMKAED